jgi:hypothetical protein
MPHCPRAIPARASALAFFSVRLVTAWMISLLRRQPSLS